MDEDGGPGDTGPGDGDGGDGGDEDDVDNLGDDYGGPDDDEKEVILRRFHDEASARGRAIRKAAKKTIADGRKNHDFLDDDDSELDLDDEE